MGAPRRTFQNHRTLHLFLLYGWEDFYFFFLILRLSLIAQLVKNLPAGWEAWVRSLGREDSLEEGMATHSSILACRIPVEPAGL